MNASETCDRTPRSTGRAAGGRVLAELHIAVFDGDGDCVYGLQRHVVAHLIDGTPPMNTAQDYLRNQEVEEAVYLSAQEGRRVSV